MSQIDFGAWLQTQLDERGWRATDLAKRAKMSDAAISRFLRGERKADPESLRAIAKALKIPVDLMFQEAGEIPPDADRDAEIDAITEELSDLSDTDKSEVLAFVRLLADLRRKRKR